MGHGGGGSLSRDLIEHVFLPAFTNPLLDRLGDSTVLDMTAELAGGGQLAISTDSYVVRPLFFPGGSIGDLAVNGTVNDLAMSGARGNAVLSDVQITNSADGNIVIQPGSQFTISGS